MMNSMLIYALWVFMPSGYLCPLGIYALWVFMPQSYIKQLLKELPSAKTLEDMEVLLPFNTSPAESRVA